MRVPTVKLDAKNVVAGVVVTALLICYLLLPKLAVGYVKVPDGYTKATTGQLAYYNNRVLSGLEVVKLTQQYPNRVFLVRSGRDFVELGELEIVYGSKGNSKQFCTEKEYGVIAIAKDGEVKGFALQAS
jgi:hypothetical protein